MILWCSPVPECGNCFVWCVGHMKYFVHWKLPAPTNCIFGAWLYSGPHGGAGQCVTGVDIIVTTLPGWGWGGGGVEPGGSDDGTTITICSFFALQLCLFAELDESAAALPP